MFSRSILIGLGQLSGVESPGSRRDVKWTYDQIASHFSETRRAPWPEIRSFLATRHGNRGIDIGCGNGRHISDLQTAAREVIGIDVSKALLNEAIDFQSASVSLLLADAFSLPLVRDSIDIALYIATLHHLPSRSERVQSLNELARVLSPKGEGLVSVWSVTAERFDFEQSQDQLIPWTLPNGKTIDRYYHIFDREEFRDELQSSALTIESIAESSGNWYAIVSSSATSP